MNERKVRVQVIGNYLEALERPLRYRGILFENVLSGCNPLAMEGEVIKDNLKYCENINHQPTLLNLRKNLSQMLSRNPDNFCQNYNIQPGGREVRYNNTSEYLILMNTSAAYTLFEKNNVVYSDTYPPNPFLADIKNDKSYRSVQFPYHRSFNWKFYYDKFIDAILKEYDGDHIILIKTNAAQWYLDKYEIKSFDSRSSQYRNMVEQLDEYFINRTGCMCIDEQYVRIPDKSANSAFPFAMSTEYAYRQYERAITDIVVNQNVSPYRAPVVMGNSLEEILLKNISSDVISRNAERFMYIREKWLSLEDICSNFSKSSDDFFTHVSKLSRFLDSENRYTLSDYALELLADKDPLEEKIDLELVAEYTKYMKLNINDIIAVYMLYSSCNEKEKFEGIIGQIIDNPDCLPINSSKRFRQNNISYLSTYPYIESVLLQTENTDTIYVRLENNCYIVFCKSKKTMVKINVDIKDTVDFHSVIDNGYVCPVECADALCSNLAFYVERARRGDGNTPVYLDITTIDKFLETLCYIDYIDILENERYVLRLNGSNFVPENYSARCNLSFLFGNNVQICHLGNGFNDQIKFYVFSKMLEEKTGGDVYWDDIYTFYYQNQFNGTQELRKIVKEPIDNKLLSNILTKKLLEKFVDFCKQSQKGPMSALLFFAENGITDGICVYNAREYDDKYLSIRVNSGEKRFDPLFFETFKNFRLTYYHIYCQLYELSTSENCDINRYIQFPPFDDDINTDIYKKILSSDSVVMHIRRGDFIPVLCGNDVNLREKYSQSLDFYQEAIKKLLFIKDYPEKKYFVFSDDIPWCKENIDKIGLDLVGNSEIIFVDNNKGVNSFRDMQLMMYGKIMIISQSGFATTAAFLNNRCEVLMPIGGKVMSKFIQAGKRYKYNVEPISSRGMFQNWG